ncbi:protein FAM228B isoform X4 [Mauremys mutica]|uniref:protein FAM228B isoform X4 n=1 Tax=Mauremys mutica TaxID=74926 RepID=UPI001D165411|nr:protein FAM228B isoform X4 [Mauremys mutica]
MEARGSSAAKEGRAPSVPQDPGCPDSITSPEAKRGSLYEDWLIRVYCPGSQCMYDVQAPEQPVQRISPSVSEKIRTISTLCKRKSSKDWLMQESSTPLEPCSGAPNMGGSENQWLLKLKCPRSQTEYDLQTPEQRATSSLARSRSPSTFGRSASERKKACEDWLTQKRFSQVQPSPSPGPPAAPPHCPSVINPMPLSISILLPPFSRFFLQAPPPLPTPLMLPPFPFTLLSLSYSRIPLVPRSCPFHPSVLPYFYQSLPPFPPFVQPPPLFLRSLPSLTFQVPPSRSFPLPRSLPALSPQLRSSLPPLALPTFPPLPVPPLALQSLSLLPPIPSRQTAFP